MIKFFNFLAQSMVDAGRPSSGVLQHTRLSVKAKYKLAIKNAYVLFEDKT